MRILLSSVMVDDQARALAFYTEKLGFVKKQDIDMGEARWLTLVSPEDSSGVELLLEPTGHPASKVFQKALFDDGIPLTAFAVTNVQAEYERLLALDVEFSTEPTDVGSTIVAVFNDACGNWIQIYQI
ncbi:MAG: VOC family protein [Caldilineaceae bacterium]|nr:VOC family protein [Caldilineaceae bacterium]